MITFEDIQAQKHIGSSELKMLCAWLYGYMPEFSSVIEIGVATGGSTMTWHKALMVDGVYIGIDINLNNPAEVLYAEVLKTVEKYKEDKRMNFIIGDSRDLGVVKKVGEILNGRLVDFLYIDGEHSEQGTIKDFDYYEPFVRVGGIIAWHDASANSNVRKAIDKTANVFNNILVGKQSWQFVGPKAQFVCRFDQKRGHCGIVAIVKE